MEDGPIWSSYEYIFSNLDFRLLKKKKPYLSVDNHLRSQKCMSYVGSVTLGSSDSNSMRMGWANPYQHLCVCRDIHFLHSFLFNCHFHTPFETDTLCISFILLLSFFLSLCPGSKQSSSRFFNLIASKRNESRQRK